MNEDANYPSKTKQHRATSKAIFTSDTCKRSIGLSTVKPDIKHLYSLTIVILKIDILQQFSSTNIHNNCQFE